jgi:protein SCO1
MRARGPGSLRRLAALIAVIPSFMGGPSTSHDLNEPDRSGAGIRISTDSYDIPDVVLIDTHGEPVALRRVLAVDRPVAMNFIFTSCTSLCPVMTATMQRVQNDLSSTGSAPDFISISIDPDFDSSAVLRDYAERHGARWRFLTGSRQDITTVLRAFDAWRGGKNNHAAVTLLRPAYSTQWTRVDGLASARTLAQVWRKSAG